MSKKLNFNLKLLNFVKLKHYVCFYFVVCLCFIGGGIEIPFNLQYGYFLTV
jgi:hypothetical protein